MNNEFAADDLDVQTFAQRSGTLRGQELLQRYERLMDQTQGRGAGAPVIWSAHGELQNPTGIQPEVWLHLKAQSVFSLTCQRCLGPVELAVQIQRAFRFVSNETLAQAQDRICEEDVLVLSHHFDLLELIEDELLMELPLAPRHETCPTAVKLAAVDADFEQALIQSDSNFFAILGKLKKNSQEKH